MATFDSRIPVSHDSVTGSQHAQNRTLEQWHANISSLSFGNWKVPGRNYFCCFCHVFFLLLSPLAEAYLSAVPLDISGSQKYMMTGGLVVWPGNIFYLSFAAIHTKGLKASLLASPVWPCGRPVTQIPSPALYCHLSPAASRPGMTLFFFFQGWWNDLTVPSVLSEYQLASTLLIGFFFRCTSFGYNIWLVYQTADSEDIQMTWLQCPLPGFCLITEIPFCNPYLMKALAKSTTEIKAVKLVKSCLSGWLKAPSSQG